MDIKSCINLERLREQVILLNPKLRDSPEQLSLVNKRLEEQLVQSEAVVRVKKMDVTMMISSFDSLADNIVQKIHQLKNMLNDSYNQEGENVKKGKRKSVAEKTVKVEEFLSDSSDDEVLAFKKSRSIASSSARTTNQVNQSEETIYFNEDSSSAADRMECVPLSLRRTPRKRKRSSNFKYEYLSPSQGRSSRVEHVKSHRAKCHQKQDAVVSTSGICHPYEQDIIVEEGVTTRSFHIKIPSLFTVGAHELNLSELNISRRMFDIRAQETKRKLLHIDNKCANQNKKKSYKKKEQNELANNKYQQEKDDAIISQLISDVIGTSGNEEETWQATNALENINNEIIDNYDVMPGFNSPPPEFLGFENHKPLKRRYNKTTKTQPKVEPKKRGRKPKPKDASKSQPPTKSNLAQYVENFSNDWDMMRGSATPAASSTMSQPLVSSTTQNFEFIDQQQTGPVTYYFNGNWANGDPCQLVTENGLPLDAVQVEAGDLDISDSFQETDLNGNISLPIITQLRHFQQTTSIQNGSPVINIQIPPLPITTTAEVACNAAPPPAHTTAGVLDLSLKSNPNISNSSTEAITYIQQNETADYEIPIEDYNNEDVPLDLSISAAIANTTSLSEHNCIDETESHCILVDNGQDDDFIRRLIETSDFDLGLDDLRAENNSKSFKAALDMPLLETTEEEQDGVLNDSVAELPIDSTYATMNEESSNYLSCTFGDDYNFADQSTKEIFNQLLEINDTTAANNNIPNQEDENTGKISNSCLEESTLHSNTSTHAETDNNSQNDNKKKEHFEDEKHDSGVTMSQPAPVINSIINTDDSSTHDNTNKNRMAVMKWVPRILKRRHTAASNRVAITTKENICTTFKSPNRIEEKTCINTPKDNDNEGLNVTMDLNNISDIDADNVLIVNKQGEIFKGTCGPQQLTKKVDVKNKNNCKEEKELVGINELEEVNPLVGVKDLNEFQVIDEPRFFGKANVTEQIYIEEAMDIDQADDESMSSRHTVNSERETEDIEDRCITGQKNDIDILCINLDESKDIVDAQDMDETKNINAAKGIIECSEINKAPNVTCDNIGIVQANTKETNSYDEGDDSGEAIVLNAPENINEAKSHTETNRINDVFGSTDDNMLLASTSTPTAVTNLHNDSDKHHKIFISDEDQIIDLCSPTNLKDSTNEEIIETNHNPITILTSTPTPNLPSDSMISCAAYSDAFHKLKGDEHGLNSSGENLISNHCMPLNSKDVGFNFKYDNNESQKLPQNIVTNNDFQNSKRSDVKNCDGDDNASFSKREKVVFSMAKINLNDEPTNIDYIFLSDSDNNSDDISQCNMDNTMEETEIQLEPDDLSIKAQIPIEEDDVVIFPLLKLSDSIDDDDNGDEISQCNMENTMEEAEIQLEPDDLGIKANSIEEDDVVTFPSLILSDSINDDAHEVEKSECNEAQLDCNMTDSSRINIKAKEISNVQVPTYDETPITSKEIDVKSLTVSAEEGTRDNPMIGDQINQCISENDANKNSADARKIIYPELHMSVLEMESKLDENTLNFEDDDDLDALILDTSSSCFDSPNEDRFKDSLVNENKDQTNDKDHSTLTEATNATINSIQIDVPQQPPAPIASNIKVDVPKLPSIDSIIKTSLSSSGGLMSFKIPKFNICSTCKPKEKQTNENTPRRSKSNITCAIIPNINDIKMQPYVKLTKIDIMEGCRINVKDFNEMIKASSSGSVINKNSKKFNKITRTIKNEATVSSKIEVPQQPLQQMSSKFKSTFKNISQIVSNEQHQPLTAILNKDTNNVGTTEAGLQQPQQQPLKNQPIFKCTFKNIPDVPRLNPSPIGFDDADETEQNTFQNQFKNALKNSSPVVTTKPIGRRSPITGPNNVVRQACATMGIEGIAQIFGVTCLPHLVNECLAPAHCQKCHQYNGNNVVFSTLNAISKTQLCIAYSFMYSHSKLFSRYFVIFCNILSIRKDRDILYYMINDCERYPEHAEYLIVIYESLVKSGLSHPNACRQLLKRTREKSTPIIDALVAIIMKSDWTMFSDYIESYTQEIYKYNFRMGILEQMAPAVLNSSKQQLHLKNIFFKCVQTLHCDDVPSLCACSPSLMECLALMAATENGER